MPDYGTMGRGRGTSGKGHPQRTALTIDAYPFNRKSPKWTASKFHNTPDTVCTGTFKPWLHWGQLITGATVKQGPTSNWLAPTATLLGLSKSGVVCFVNLGGVWGTLENGNDVFIRLFHCSAPRGPGLLEDNCGLTEHFEEREREGKMINQEKWNKTTENNLGEPNCSYQWGSVLK